MKDFKAAKDRAYYARRRRAALAHKQLFFEQLEQLEAHPVLKTFIEQRRQFRSTFSLLEGVLRHELIRSGTRLMREIRVRDIAAEQRRDDEAERAAIRDGRQWVAPSEPRPLYRTEMAPFGVIKGAEFFREESNPLTAVRSEVRLIKGAISELEKTAENVNAQRLIFKGLAASFGRVREQLSVVSMLPLSLSDENLNLLAGWARERDLPGEYTSGPGYLQAEFEAVDGGGTKRWTVASDFIAPTGEALDRFEMLLAETDVPSKEEAT